MPEEVGEEEGTREPKGNGEDDREGQDVALILCAQDEVDEEQTEPEDEGSRVGGILLLARHTSVVVAVACREGRAGNFGDGTEDVPCRIAGGRRCHHVDGGVEVEAVHTRWAVNLLRSDEGGDRCHLP